jgi:hypothetical protein
MRGKRPIIVVHNAAHALAAAAAAVEAGRPVLLRSAEGAAGYAGALWFQEVIKLAQSAHPEADIAASLDCGDAPGHALGALRQGLKLVRLHVRPTVKAKVAAIARQLGAGIDDMPGPALDLLGHANPADACRVWFQERPGGESRAATRQAAHPSKRGNRKG